MTKHEAGSMKPEKFSHEIVGTSRTFYRSQDLKVVIEGDTAKTDGNTVFIPAMAMDKNVPLERQRITRGYVDHEAGHGRHTTWDEVRRVAGTRYAKHLSNAMEDVRIEKLIIEEYPGSQNNLKAVSDAVNRLFLKHAKEDPSITKDFNRIGAVAITWEGRRRLGYDIKSNEECLDTLDPKIRERVNKIVDLVERTTSTKDVVDIALTIDKELEDEEAGGGGPTTPRRGRGGGGAGAGGGGAGSGAGGAGSGSPMFEASPADAMTDLASTEARRGGGYRVWTWDKDHVFSVRSPPTGSGSARERHRRFRDYALSSGASRYAQAKNSIAANVNQMRRKLERALISKQNRGWVRNQEEGALDSRRLVAALGGATNVHRLREPVDDLDVAVLLVVDLSGSMNNEKIRLARASTICYAEALEKVQIPFAVVGFTCLEGEGQPLNPGNHNTYESMYRNFPLDLYLFKDFDESLKKAHGGIGTMSGDAISMGNNADGDSLLQFYWKFLKDRKESRRVMIVFSDGQPAAHGGNQDQRLRDVISYIESEGVELIGVGILSEAPKKYYKKHTLVTNLGDLAKESLNILARLLIDPKFKVDNSELMGVTEKLSGRR